MTNTIIITKNNLVSINIFNYPSAISNNCYP